LRPASWNEAFAAIKSKLKSTSVGRVGALAGDLASTEEMFALKDLLTRLGVKNLDCRQDGSRLDPAWAARAIFSTRPSRHRKGRRPADHRREPAQGSRRASTRAFASAGVRATSRRGNRRKSRLTYSYDLSRRRRRNAQRRDRGQACVAESLKKAERPMVIVGQGATLRPDSAAIVSACSESRCRTRCDQGWLERFLRCCMARRRGSAVSMLASCRATVACAPRDGCVRRSRYGVLLGADEVEMAKGAFIVYVGSHGEPLGDRADVILPGAAYTEKSAIYVNTEGRVQWRTAPCSRRARRAKIGRPARAVRTSWPQAAL